MKPYQFKTMNLAGSAAQPGSSLNQSSANGSSFYTTSLSINKNKDPVPSHPSKPVNQNVTDKAVSLQKKYPSQNVEVDIGKQNTEISSMKSKLELLLKQTEMLTERKNHHSVGKINEAKSNENSKYSTTATNIQPKKEPSPQKLYPAYQQSSFNKPYQYGYNGRQPKAQQPESSPYQNPSINAQSTNQLEAKSCSYTSFSKSYQQLRPDSSIQNQQRFQVPIIQNLNLSTYSSLKGNSFEDKSQLKVNYEIQKLTCEHAVQKPMSVLVAPKSQREFNKEKSSINIDRASTQHEVKPVVSKPESVPPVKIPIPEAPSQRPQSTSNQFNYYNDYTKLTLNSTSNAPAKNTEPAKPLQIPNNLSECQYKLRQLDFQNRKIQQQLNEMLETKEYYRKESSQKWRDNKKQKEDYEQQIKEIHEDYSIKINELKNSIEGKDKKIKDLINELAEAKVVPNSQNFEQRSKNIVSENEKLTFTILEKDKEISNLKADLAEKDLKCQSVTDKFKALEDEVAALNNYKKQTMHTKMENFDQILKVQLKSISEFKEMIERLNEKNNDLREKLIESNRKNEFLANEQRILQLKHTSAMNGAQMSFAIDQSNKQNLISTLNKKILTLEDKYKSSLSDIKTKDEFLRAHLVGRTDSLDLREYIENVLKKYTQSFGESKEEALKVELDKAKAKIELLEKYK